MPATRIIHFTLAIALLAALAARSFAAPEVSPPLSADEVKKLVNAGQYKDALQALTRIIDLKGPAAAAYDRHEMLMLRADCQLQIKQTTAALDTLELARKEAAAAFVDDHANEAIALTMLIKQSPGGIFTPQTGAVRKPIPIADRILRKAAFDALFADQMIQVTAKVRAAKKGNSLLPIADAAKSASAVRPIERASAGDNKQTDAILTDLSQSATKLITSATDDLNNQTQRISDAANRVVTEDVFVTDPSSRQQYLSTQTHRVGLAIGDGQKLKNIMTDAAKIATACGEFAGFFANDPAPFKSAAKVAQNIKEKANTVLTDNYTVNVK